MPAAKVTGRRWNDPPVAGEGTRVLITRYRPRGVSKARETWEEWWPQLGPSAELLAAFHGKEAPPIDFATYTTRYKQELADDPGRFYLRAMAGRVAAGESLALLCSSACVDPERCHRTILAARIRELAAATARAAR